MFWVDGGSEKERAKKRKNEKKKEIISPLQPSLKEIKKRK